MDFIEYMRAIAQSSKDIANQEGQHFHRVAGLGDMVEFLENQYPGFHLMPVYTDDTRYIDRDSDNLMQREYFSFFLAKDYNPGDHDDLETQKNAMRAVAKKIISKILYDARQNEKVPRPQWTGLNILERDSFSMRVVGPLGDGYVAMYVSFTTLDAATDITYNPDDWQ